MSARAAQRVAERRRQQEKEANCVVEEDVQQAFHEVMRDPHLRGRKRSEKKLWKTLLMKVHGGRSRCSRFQFEHMMRAYRLSTSHDRSDDVEELGVGGEERDESLNVHMQAGNVPPKGPPWARWSFDKILCDVPCTAMGQKPMLEWRYTIEDVDKTACYQRQFLVQAYHLLKPGGDMMYSTCTLTAEENELNVAWALDHLRCDDCKLILETTSLEHPALYGFPECKLSEEDRRKVIRFDPRIWDLGFFGAKFRKIWLHT